jgi:U3 small nucleolar RNA-associated protein 18
MTQATGATASLGDILMRRGQPLLAQRQVSLPQRRLDIVRLANANKEGVSGGAVRCTEYHPHAPVLLTAGLDKTLRLFHVDGKENARLQAVHFADLPIYSAQFTPDGQRIYLSGRRPFFYAYDLVTGTASRVAGLQGHATVKSLESMYIGSNGELVFLGGDGTLVIVDERTRHWVADMKMNGSARHAAFVDEHTLVSAGTDGFAYVWDIRMRRCKHRFVDQGALKCTSLAASPRASYLAFG